MNTKANKANRAKRPRLSEQPDKTGPVTTPYSALDTTGLMAEFYKLTASSGIRHEHQTELGAVLVEMDKRRLHLESDDAMTTLEIIKYVATDDKIETVLLEGNEPKTRMVAIAYLARFSNEETWRGIRSGGGTVLGIY